MSRGFGERRPIRATRTLLAAVAIVIVAVGALVLSVIGRDGGDVSTEAAGAATGSPGNGGVGLPTAVDGAAGAPGATASEMDTAAGAVTGNATAGGPASGGPGAGDAAGAVGAAEGQGSTDGVGAPAADAGPNVPALGSGASGMATIGSGTYIVGTEIQPGQYRVAGSYVRLDATMDIIDADGVYEEGEMTIMQVAATDAFVEISGEAMEVGAFRQTIGGPYPVVELGVRGGTYLVGEDIAPGRYRVEDTSYAWATRLSCDGEFVDHQSNEGSVISIVEATDCLFSFSGILTRLDG